jgi:hypothetical protein
MVQFYRVEPLPADQVMIAYPLVTAAFPAVGLQQWQDYAGGLAGASPAESGVLALRNDAGYFCGLIIYRNDRGPWHEPRLNVDLFVALDLIDAGTATAALIEAAEAKAADLGCTAVFIRLDGGLESIRAQLRAAGYRPTDGVVAKTIQASTRPN